MFNNNNKCNYRRIILLYGLHSNDHSHLEIYAGNKPFSEPESQAQRDDMATLTNVKAYLTYHAFSEAGFKVMLFLYLLSFY